MDVDLEPIPIVFKIKATVPLFITTFHLEIQIKMKNNNNPSVTDHFFFKNPF